MNEAYDIRAVDLSAVLNTSAEEKAKQLPEIQAASSARRGE